MDEFLALAYHAERGLDCVIARLFNTVGPRQSGQYGMVIPRFVERALAGRPLEIHGDGTQTRCFCHVPDTIRALKGLIEDRSLVGRHLQRRLDRPDLDPRAGGPRPRGDRLGLASSSSSPTTEVYGQGIEDMLHRDPVDRARSARRSAGSPSSTLDGSCAT